MTAGELRRRFGSLGYEQGVIAGRLTVKLLKDRHPSAPRAREPNCTRSQIVGYFRGRVNVAIVHQYLRPDGTIGASGRPDPKRVRDGNVIYTL